MYIVLDTNIYRNDYTLAGPEFAELFGFLERTQFTLIVPTIVIDEVRARFREDIANRFNAYRSALGNLERIMAVPLLKAPIVDFDDEVKKFITRITTRARVRILVEDFGVVNLADVVRRGIERRRPADTNGEQLRDVAIWLGTLNLAKRVNEKVVFISGDNRAFGKSGKKDSFQENEGLHPDLQAEIGREKLQLEFYKDIGSFLLSQSSHWDRIDRQIWQRLVNEPLILTAIEQAAKDQCPEIDNISEFVFRNGVRYQVDEHSSLIRVEYKGCGQPANPPLSRPHNTHFGDLDENCDHGKGEMAAWVDYVEIPFKVWVTARLLEGVVTTWRIEGLEFPDRDELFRQEIIEYYLRRIMPAIESGESEETIRTRYPKAYGYLRSLGALPVFAKPRLPML